MTDDTGTQARESLDDLERQLDMANRQLARFAEDLRRMVLEERARSADLAAANRRLAVLDRLKSEFLAFISHELRTPLTGLSAMTMIDLQSDLNGQAELLHIARSAYDRLEDFVQRGLEYFDWLARPPAEPGDTTDLATVVRTATVSLHVDLCVPAAPCPVQGETRALARVVGILLQNAVKFAPGAPARVSVVRGDADTTLVVEDRGRGFPPHVADDLFRPFTVSMPEHHSRGSGLNLALARAMLEVFRGRITAASAGVGHGARFTVVLKTAAGT